MCLTNACTVRPIVSTQENSLCAYLLFHKWKGTWVTLFGFLHSVGEQQMWNCIAAANTLHPAQAALWHCSLINSPYYFLGACTFYMLTNHHFCEVQTQGTLTDEIFLILQVWSCAVQGGQRLCNGQLLQQQKVGDLPTPRKWVILFKM